MKPKWGGFKRQFTSMADRDPWPHVPFVDAPLVVTKGDKLLFGVSAAVVLFLIMFGGHFGWAW